MKQTNKQNHPQTNKQYKRTNKQTNKQTNKHAYKQTTQPTKQANKQTNKQTNKRTNKQLIQCPRDCTPLGKCDRQPRPGGGACARQPSNIQTLNMQNTRMTKACAFRAGAAPAAAPGVGGPVMGKPGGGACARQATLNQTQEIKHWKSNLGNTPMKPWK
jgi:hypothetical protein